VNFLYDDIVHALQNTIDSACKAIEFGDKRTIWAITPFKVIQGHQGRYQSKA